jgi:hypothetical protein
VETTVLVQAANPFPTLERHKSANLSKFRKSGELIVTPVCWRVSTRRLPLVNFLTRTVERVDLEIVLAGE